MASVDNTENPHTGMTVEKLKQVMKNTGVGKHPAPRVEPKAGVLSPFTLFQQALESPYDEVYEGVYIGDSNLAQDKDNLQLVGITHVVNAAQGQKFNQIDTNAEYYADINVKFFGVNAIDTPRFQMQKYFHSAADFIEEAIEDTGKVYVHCQQGLSRSATLVLAFLMLKRTLSVEEAAILVRQKRPVMPNDGFLQQLVDLDMKLQCLKNLCKDHGKAFDSSEASEVTLETKQSNDEADNHKGQVDHIGDKATMASVDSAENASPGLTVERLKKVINNTLPSGVGKRPAARVQPIGGVLSPFALFQHAVTKENPYNEVYQGVYIGDSDLAQDKDNLQLVGITHVVNAAQGQKFNQIDTNAEYYADINVKFFGVNAIDTPRFQMQKYFHSAADFIEEAIEDTGKVYVHCRQGLSRSATLVLAFLMLKRSLTVEEAAILVRQKRLVMPNDGFLQQLVDLEMELQCLKNCCRGNNNSFDSSEASEVPLESEQCNAEVCNRHGQVDHTVGKMQSLDTNSDEGASVLHTGGGPHDPLTLEDVKEVMQNTIPEGTAENLKKKAKKKGNAGTVLYVRNGNRSSPALVNDIDIVYPGICIGNHKIARDTRGLKALDITHILNTAHGDGAMQVNTSEAYYAVAKINFCGIPAKDTAAFNLKKYFDTATEFIATAVASNGKVLVHCHQGRSRSAAVVLAYLMLRENMLLLDAIKIVRQKRWIWPNDGFLKQLIDVNSQLFSS